MNRSHDLLESVVPDIREIITAAAVAADVTVGELIGPRRTWPLVSWRQVAMHVARERTGASYPALGRVFNRDHSTVVYAVAVVGERLDGGHEPTVRAVRRVEAAIEDREKQAEIRAAGGVPWPREGEERA